MTVNLGELFAFIVLAAVIGTIGVALGILFLAPSLSRLAERNDEEPRVGDD